ncbi:hypothetical protein QBC46DRAFT_384758 [Diplogelasinospora grovesii]|uniref:Uncharacterized protein n=1 Tax=Diplogelasinospora grovesii TaxID=303347 RepID=A0AAN6N8P7_9PEZI|nr:hypothetical protein QBC46DRAFT_384758 [Diplogelasinospora grovesii]
MTQELKRKRSLSIAPHSQLPADSINPLSHPPQTLRQFIPAGYSSDAPLPSKVYPGFPHRGISSDKKPSHPPSSASHSHSQSHPHSSPSASRPSSSSSSSGDDQTEVEGDTEAKEQEKERRSIADKKAREIYHEKQLGTLTTIIQRCLASGDIPRAKRAFALLLRSKVRGRKVDLRGRGYWEFGAEILSRETANNNITTNQWTPPVDDHLGEDDDDDDDGRGEQARLLAAQNLPRIKTYYEALIQLHPYNKSHPTSVNALDFYPLLWAAEMDAIHTIHKHELRKLETEPEEESEEDPMDLDDGYGGYENEEDGEDGEGEGRWEERERRLREREQQYANRERNKREKIRQDALGKMKELVGRMDNIVEIQPFSSDAELLRLRGMAGLFLSDLLLPARSGGGEGDVDDEDEQYAEARAARDKEREKARTFFQRMIEHGGSLDQEPWLADFMESESEDSEEEPERPLPMYSSLPMR